MTRLRKVARLVTLLEQGNSSFLAADQDPAERVLVQAELNNAETNVVAIVCTNTTPNDAQVVLRRANDAELVRQVPAGVVARRTPLPRVIPWSKAENWLSEPGHNLELRGG